MSYLRLIAEVTAAGILVAALVAAFIQVAAWLALALLRIRSSRGRTRE